MEHIEVNAGIRNSLEIMDITVRAVMKDCRTVFHKYYCVDGMNIFVSEQFLFLISYAFILAKNRIKCDSMARG